jgi:tetratricopeptide (TPR) repeat protein
MKQLFILLTALLFFHNTYAQSEYDKLKALDFALEAMELINKDDNWESIYLLKKAQKLDPDNFAYPYEIGVAYFLQNDNKNAIKHLKKASKKESSQVQCFSFLAKVYKANNQQDKAIDTYEKGIEKFSYSGELYFELGFTFHQAKILESAILFWEKGIAYAPSYASNYYAASIYYCQNTSEQFWGMLYGELFMNLERDTERTDEISTLLYSTYQQTIIYAGKQSNINLMPIHYEIENKRTFPTLYKQVMDSVLQENLEEKEFSIRSFTLAKTAFTNKWYANQVNQTFKNSLIDWNKKLLNLGYFEAYSYWLLRKANQKEFEKWYYFNKKKFDAFLRWFSINPLEINQENHFYRYQYDNFNLHKH